MTFKIHRIILLNGMSELKAYVHVGIDDQFVIKGVQVAERRFGLQVILPKENGKSHHSYEIIQFLDTKTKNDFHKIVLDGYLNKVEEEAYIQKEKYI